MQAREHEWDARWWSPIINAEHLAMRDRAAMFDLTAFCIFDVVGADALESVQKVAARQMNVPSGRVIYTPVLTPSGGFKSDLTIMKMDDDRFRVVTGGAHGMADKKWFADNLAGDGADRGSDVDAVHGRALGPAGARHPRVGHERRRLERGLPVQHVAGPSRSTEWRCSPRGSRTSATSDGSSTSRWSEGAKLWDAVWEAGQAARRRARRHRRLRHDRQAREGVPRLRLRARRRLHRRRGGHGVVEGEERGLRRQGGAPRDTARPSRWRSSAR